MRAWQSLFPLVFLCAAPSVNADPIQNDELWRIDHGIVRDAASGLIYSHPGNIYTQGSTVVYDEARDIINQVALGHPEAAKRPLDFLIDTASIHKRGWVHRRIHGHDQTLIQDGWIPNVIRGKQVIEPLADIGPNAYLALAALHVYQVTHEERYLKFAVQTGERIAALQNDSDSNDPNYGAVRMGPLGDPTLPNDQHGGINAKNPARYHTYNTENTIDSRRLFVALAWQLQSQNHNLATDFQKRIRLIDQWLPKIFDPHAHFFYEGSLETSGSSDELFTFGMLVDVGKTPDDLKNPSMLLHVPAWHGKKMAPFLIPAHPLDATHLAAAALGVAAYDQLLGKGEFAALLEETERDYRVNAVLNDGTVLSLYDTLPACERERMISYRQTGARRDQKIRIAEKRHDLGTIEWTGWVNHTPLAGIVYEKTQHPEVARTYMEWYVRNLNNTRAILRAQNSRAPNIFHLHLVNH